MAKAFQMFKTRPSHEDVKLILKEIRKMADDLLTLVADVAAQKTVIDSAVTLLNGLAASLRAAINDPAALTKLATDIEASTASLANAVATDTPAAPPAPTATPTPTPPATPPGGTATPPSDTGTATPPVAG